MPIPVQVLLAFAGWTLLTLLVGVGLVRWRLILTGRRRLNEFPADTPHGSPRYRRAMRAHANCVENLPVFGAIALGAVVAGITSPALDALAVTFFGARIGQTVTHIAFEETSTAVGVRFAFFFTQVLCLAAMLVLVARH